MKTETLTTVPIGIPIPNCEVLLFGDEIYVSGQCIANGYFNHEIIPLDTLNLQPGSAFVVKESKVFFKTGDFAKKLGGGELVFVGRNDRTVKVNGHRIGLEEIENTMRLHENVDDVVVVFENGEGEVGFLEAYVVVKKGCDFVKSLRFCIRGWMIEKLPLAMIPRRFFFVESIPLTFSGKVDYDLLASSRCSNLDICGETDEVLDDNLLQTIKEAFCESLVVEKVNNNDDFFSLGGDSISAAHISHKLGINMKLLYKFPTPFNLFMALMDPQITNQKETKSLTIVPKNTTDLKTNKQHGRLFSEFGENGNEYNNPHKVLKKDSDSCCAITRCNKVLFGQKYDIIRLFQETIGDKKVSIKKEWKVHMGSCVDASPLVVVRENDMFLYIGSHSHKFICVKAQK